MTELSALMTVRDEPWLQPSAFSIDRVADEIVIVDASSSPVLDEVRNIDRQTSAEVVYERTEPDLREQTRLALKLASFDNLIRWDGDMVAFKQIEKLLDVIDKAPRYYAIHFPMIDLGSSFFLTSRTQPGLTHREPYVFSNSWVLGCDFRPKKLVKSLVDEFPPRLQQHPLPVFYRDVFVDEPLAIHLRGLKSGRRKREKYPQGLWANMGSGERGVFGSFDAFVGSSAEVIWGKLAERTKENHFDGCFEKFEGYWDSGVVESENVCRYGGEFPVVLRQWIKSNYGVCLEDSVEFRSWVQEFLKS